MQIVVPAAGRGQRFKYKRYKEPKPLIDALGKPIIKWSTDGLTEIDNPKFIFLILKEHLEESDIEQKLKRFYGENSKIVPVEGVTEGAACTVLLAKEFLNPEEDMAIVNCDNLFSVNIKEAKDNLSKNDGGIVFYFASNNPVLSYVETDEDGYAKRLAEKEIISDKATLGCYYFSKAKHFIESAEEMIKKNIRVKGEFYIAPTYNILIGRGVGIKTYPVEFHFNLGTPKELDRFKLIFDTSL